MLERGVFRGALIIQLYDHLDFDEEFEYDHMVMLQDSKLYDGHFYDLLYTDVENNFKRSISNYNKEEACVSIDSDGQQKILDVLMGRQNQSSLNPRLSFAYRKIYEDYFSTRCLDKYWNL